MNDAAGVHVQASSEGVKPARDAARMLGGQPFHQPLPPHRFRRIGREVNVVAADGQLAHHRVVVPVVTEK